MASNLYTKIEFEEAQSHDNLLLDAQKVLLQKIVAGGNPGSVRNYAEAYALVTGNITSLGSSD